MVRHLPFFLFEDLQMMKDILKTERLVLRPFEAADASRVAHLIGNWNVARMLASPPFPYARTDAVKYIAADQAARRDASYSAYAITLEEGLIGCISVALTKRGPNLGYWLGEPFWGRGLMSEAACAVTAEFFRAMTKEPVLTSGVFAENPASLAIQRKLGFETVGERPVYCNARGHDVRHIDTELTRARHQETRQ